MKKLFLITFLAIHFFSMAQAEKEASIKMQYLPQNIYTVTHNSSNNFTMTYVGAENILQSLADKGVENPTIQKRSARNVMQISTGKLSSKNDFPVQMRFIASDNEALSQFVKSGAVIHGRGTTDTFPIFDSISGSSLSKDMQDVFLKAIQAVLSQIKFPDEKLKIGESASIDTPFSVPIGAMTIDMNVNTAFKLIAIDGNIAEYNVDVVFTVTSNIKGYNLVGGGDGSGKMYFDTANGYYKSYTNEMNMDMSVDMGQLQIQLKMEQTSEATAEVKKK